MLPIIIGKAPISRGTERGAEENIDTNTIYIQNDQDCPQVVTAKDSAIDLRTTALEQDKSAFTIDAPMIESTSSSFTCSTPSPPPSPTLTPAIVMTTKKKVSSWSPRRIFSSKNKETKQQEKFNISSLFSRSSSPKKKITSTKSVLINSTATTTSDKKEFQLKSNFNYTRLPIHTERAIYRLSHMKLTNPRRPLCDQVTISNLMFWYLSIISQQNNENNNNVPLPIDSIVLTKKACHIQIHQRRPSKKRSSHKRIRNHQIGPDSNAMDTLNKQRHLSYRNTHLRTSNSSSDEEDEEGFSDDDLSDDDEDIMHSLYSNDKSKKKGTKKYSIFNYSSSKNNNNSWLSTFSPKQHTVSSTRQDEDDIPLAMYQKGKV